MRIRQNRPGLALFLSGMLSGGLLVGLGLVSAQTPAALSVRPLRLEALVAVAAKSGPSGAVLPRNAAQLRFYCELSAPVESTTLRGTWIAEDVGSAASPNTVIASTDVPASASLTPKPYSFSLKRPKTDWPAGKYRLEVTTEGNQYVVVEIPGESRRDLVDTVKRQAQLRFRVVAQSGAGVSSVPPTEAPSASGSAEPSAWMTKAPSWPDRRDRPS